MNRSTQNETKLILACKKQQREGYLPQTDRVSQKVLACTGGVVDPVTIILSSNFISKQDLVVVCDTVLYE